MQKMDTPSPLENPQPGDVYTNAHGQTFRASLVITAPNPLSKDRTTTKRRVVWTQTAGPSDEEVVRRRERLAAAQQEARRHERCVWNLDESD